MPDQLLEQFCVINLKPLANVMNAHISTEQYICVISLSYILNCLEKQNKQRRTNMSIFLLYIKYKINVNSLSLFSCVCVQVHVRVGMFTECIL